MSMARLTKSSIDHLLALRRPPPLLLKGPSPLPRTRLSRRAKDRRRRLSRRAKDRHRRLSRRAKDRHRRLSRGGPRQQGRGRPRWLLRGYRPTGTSSSSSSSSSGRVLQSRLRRTFAGSPRPRRAPLRTPPTPTKACLRPPRASAVYRLKARSRIPARRPSRAARARRGRGRPRRT